MRKSLPQTKTPIGSIGVDAEIATSAYGKHFVLFRRSASSQRRLPEFLLIGVDAEIATSAYGKHFVLYRRSASSQRRLPEFLLLG